ncbi:hypothetical protein V7O66_03065 [Methanolobus sp. ZRKC3]|uniref:hypothetical protein n=1 Tax=Methanolobus sp. ZRKC3 TaxID=3125786 RepID=UPI0032436AF7
MKHVEVDFIVYIRKEANNIDEQALDVKRSQEFVNKHEIMDNILQMPQKQAEALKISRNRFQGIKQRIRETEDLNLNTPAVRRLTG